MEVMQYLYYTQLALRRAVAAAEPAAAEQDAVVHFVAPAAAVGHALAPTADLLKPGLGLGMSQPGLAVEQGAVAAAAEKPVELVQQLYLHSLMGHATFPVLPNC